MTSQGVKGIISQDLANQEPADQGKTQQGKVYLVGAGVAGTAGLTRQALDILQAAEVLVYDALVDPQVLQVVGSQCELHCVGKRGNSGNGSANQCPRYDQTNNQTAATHSANSSNLYPQTSYPQSEINRLLVAYAQAGKLTVRLKSGDPWIFGRAVSELQALHEAQCEYEVINGISSAIAAPLAAGIPLTDKEVSNCFAVLTGHDLEQLPWSGLGQLPTLVILMGTGNLPQILERLQPAKPADTPIAIIQWCGRPEQKIWDGTLENILTKLPEKNLAPAVIVVGEVVRFREWIKIAPPLSLPLSGKRILVTRAAGQASQFTDLLTAQGATVLEMPTLAILPPPSWTELDHAISQIETYDWLILTSANAVDAFFGRLRHYGKDSRCLHRTKVAVVGQKTAQFLENHGIVPDLIPTDFIADALVTEFMALLGNDKLGDERSGVPNSNSLKVLFPRVASGGREVLVEQFQQAGIAIEAVAAYESGCPPQADPIIIEALRNRHVDLLTFASSKTVHHFCQLLDGVTTKSEWQTWLEPMQIASIGPQTSIACQKHLQRVDIEAQEYTLDGLVKAIMAQLLNL